MTYSESLPYLQKAFAMMKKEILSRVGSGQGKPDEFVNAVMAEDVITRALAKEMKNDSLDKTPPVEKDRYTRFFKIVNRC